MLKIPAVASIAHKKTMRSCFSTGVLVPTPEPALCTSLAWSHVWSVAAYISTSGRTWGCRKRTTKCLFAHESHFQNTFPFFWKSVGMCLNRIFFLCMWFSFRIPKGGVPTWRPSWQSLRTGVFGCHVCPWLPPATVTTRRRSRGLPKPAQRLWTPPRRWFLRPPFSYRGSDVLWEHCFAKFGGSRIFSTKITGGRNAERTKS